MLHWYVGTIAGVPKSLRHGCRSHQVVMHMEGRMFLLDPQLIVGQSPGPGYLASRCGGGGFFEGFRIGLPALVGNNHLTSSDGLGASSLCWVGRRASSNTQAVDGIG